MMNVTNCLIVDDENLALDILVEYINRVDHLRLAGNCSNAMDAITFLNNEKVDLLFLDIQMPGLTGLQMLRSLSVKPEVILTTAYSDYALEGFELQALDYLIKPISFERFVKAINRYFQIRQHHISIPESLSPNTYSNTFIFVKSDKMMVKIVLSQILYIESLRNYVVVYLENGKMIKTMNTISNLEEKLPETHFLRVHRSFIIAYDKIDSFNSGSIRVNKQLIPVGRQYKDIVKQRLDRNSIE